MSKIDPFSNKILLENLPLKTVKILATLCESLPLERYQRMSTEIERAVNKMRQGFESDHSLQIDLANRMAAVLNLLLREETDPEHKPLIVGAIRYFVLEFDDQPDTASEDGLLDDLAVMNAVLKVIGRDDLVLAP